MSIVRSLTILLGCITAAVLAFQAAMISAMDMKYWEVGEGSTGWSIWLGVVAVGLLLGASIVLLHQPRVASLVYLACLPLVGFYELNQNKGGFVSLEIPESLGIWLGLMTLVLAILAFACHLEQESQPDTASQA